MKHTYKTLSLAGFALAASFNTASADALHGLTEIGQAQFGNVARADGHAPIGVMGDHLHKKRRMDGLIPLYANAYGWQPFWYIWYF